MPCKGCLLESVTWVYSKYLFCFDTAGFHFSFFSDARYMKVEWEGRKPTRAEAGKGHLEMSGVGLCPQECTGVHTTRVGKTHDTSGLKQSLPPLFREGAPERAEGLMPTQMAL